MIFDIVQLSKQYKSRYINIIWYLSTKLYTCLAYFTYHNKHIIKFY